MRQSCLMLMLVALIPAMTACDDVLGPTGNPDAPANVTYELIPSGNPIAPAGVLLSWELPASGRANSFNVYARNSAGAQWQLRATTTSATFHDAGLPEAQYYVATRDQGGNEIAQSTIVAIDLAPRLPAPLGFVSTSMNSAIHLVWSSNAVDAGHDVFDHYLVYSTAYDDTRGVCTTGWVLEGNTVSDAFLVGNLANGVSRCFAVSAVSHDGHESQWSAERVDTPRPDARNTLVYTTPARADSAGFLFLDEAAKKLGVVTSAVRADRDFTLERHPDGSVWVTPGRAGVTLTLYSAQPVAELMSVDRAPATGFGSGAVQAQPGYAYVFRVVNADGVHFAAVRVAYVAADYVVFDWSYQTAPGNAELARAPMD